MNCKELLGFGSKYDIYKYPVGLYQDLVVNGNVKKDKRRFELMGAWKTGSIRIDNNGNEYTDTIGNKYKFTERWASHTPVGYDVWRRLDREGICDKIPDELTENQPHVISCLMKTPGFGFIWALFVAHICKPTVFPLYDQHVYRAFRYITSNGTQNPNLAPAQWSEFIEYCKFFNECLEKCGKNYWELDQALWVYGKSIKQKTVRTESSINEDFKNINKEIYVILFTLSRGKPFLWFIDDECNIHVVRKFRGGITNSKIISSGVINDLFSYLSGPIFRLGFPLSNNVEKLYDDTENPGIGKFLYQQKGFTLADAQLASHLAAIFVSAGVWRKNGRLYQFTDAGGKEWCKHVKDYYLDQFFDQTNTDSDNHIM